MTSTFKKSESSFEPPKKPDSYKRSRTLKRGCSFAPAAAEHIRWLWAAYGTGSFPDSARFPPGLSSAEFRLRAEQMLIEMIRDGHDGIMLLDREGRPIGFVTVWRVNHPAQAPQFHPHVDWFKFDWVKPRNKLECALHFLIEAKKEALGIIIAEPDNWRFFGHLCKYGVLRRVGTFRGYWADGRDGGIFETVR